MYQPWSFFNNSIKNLLDVFSETPEILISGFFGGNTEARAHWSFDVDQIHIVQDPILGFDQGLPVGGHVLRVDVAAKGFGQHTVSRAPNKLDQNRGLGVGRGPEPVETLPAYLRLFPEPLKNLPVG
jgi:hypothetical protein